MDEIKIICAPQSPKVEGVYEEDKEDRAKALRAAHLIGGSFIWEDTVEGPVFWQSVYDRLEQIAKNGRLK